MGSERYSNHHHSVSDGVLSYSGSPDNIQAPRWTSPVKKFNLGGPASSIAGGNLWISFLFLSSLFTYASGEKNYLILFVSNTLL